MTTSFTAIKQCYYKIILINIAAKVLFEKKIYQSQFKLYNYKVVIACIRIFIIHILMSDSLLIIHFKIYHMVKYLKKINL